MKLGGVNKLLSKQNKSKQCLFSKLLKIYIIIDHKSYKFRVVTKLSKQKKSYKAMATSKDIYKKA